MALGAGEIRETFLRFFEKRGHRRVASLSMIPDNDPTLLFVNAGMVPFKNLFLGEEVRDYDRATSSQKCMRVSGKHNDLENVGRTPRHHTFFEMLGNFSFGAYFKREAIEFAWELVAQDFGIDPARLVATVFREDDEAYDIWRDGIGLPSEKVIRLDEAENFWSMGATGPCGPCSEIHVDFGVNADCTSTVCDPSCDCGRWLEIWNLVFMQFDRDASGKATPLPKPSNDTGAGLERMAAIIQGVSSNYDTDLFRGILARAQDISGVSRGSDSEKDVSLNVVADHARAITFLVGDGVLPANEGRGYVLRRILRRAARHGVLLGVEKPFLFQVADAVIDEMAGAYPELNDRRDYITDRIEREETRFLETLSKGLVLLEEHDAELSSRGETTLAGDAVFRLYDTFGFPVDLTADILHGHGITLDQAGFDASMQVQRERARAAWKGSGDVKTGEVYKRIAKDVATTFTGYEQRRAEAKIEALIVEGRVCDVAKAGDAVEVVVDVTPFYAESGGQVGDSGEIRSGDGRVSVSDTQRPVGELVVHRGRVEKGEIRVDSAAELVVGDESRDATVRNHSGTHLLHAALRRVIGSQAMQKGSLVGPERLRFDFTHDAPLTRDEIEAIEDLANEWIEANIAGETREMAYADAVEAGAIAIFEEKYGDQVRVVSFGDVSTELCGGTHARATGDIGLLKIVSEGGIAAGVRRIEALTGRAALLHMRQQEHLLRDVAAKLKAAPAELPERVEKLLEERRAQDREIEQLKAAQRQSASSDLTSEVVEIAGVRVLSARVDGVAAKDLRNMIDELRAKIGSGIVLLASEQGGRLALAVGVTKDLTDRYRAGDLMREIAGIVGGKGGGRPDFAQGGGEDPSRLTEAFERFEALVAEG
jgi:alanyl-tRNA synthetase